MLLHLIFIEFLLLGKKKKKLIFIFYKKSVMVATKFFDDYFQSNSYFSKIGGIELKEMNRLEVDLMKLIQYEFFISKDLFDCYLEEIKVLSENF